LTFKKVLCYFDKIKQWNAKGQYPEIDVDQWSFDGLGAKFQSVDYLFMLQSIHKASTYNFVFIKSLKRRFQDGG
jgi:hypothetical protein